MIETNQPWIGYAIAGAAGAMFNPASDIVIANVSGERLLGGVIFEGYTGASFSMHVAGFAPNWMSRDLMWAVFTYAFVQIGVKKLITTTPEDNLKSLALNERLGFKREAVIEDAFPSGDAIIMSMRREDCRWLSLKPTTIQEGSNGRQGTGPGGTGFHPDHEGVAAAVAAEL
jgi:hypothetical protein